MPGMNHIRHPVETISRYRQLMVGSFKNNGSSNPTALSGDLAKVGAVVHTSTGVLTYTFTKKPGKLKSVLAFLRGPFTAGDYLQATYDSAAGTITVTTKDGGGVTDIPDAENIYVELWVWCSHVKNMVND
jgi:hypothetical protein